MRLKGSEARDGLRHYFLTHTPVGNHCLVEPRSCAKSAGRYRTLDGTCNNPVHPLWGRSLTPYARLLPPMYADGLNQPRVATSGRPLPSARRLSSRLAKDLDIPDRRLSLMFMHWGQFVAHDITLGVSTRLDTDDGQGLTCCPAAQANRNRLRQKRAPNTGHNTVADAAGKLKGEDQLTDENDPLQRTGIRRLSTQQHPACTPIDIPANDPFYSEFNRTCMNFVRNAASPTYGCVLGPREQANQVTHFIDASHIYGSTASRARLVRSKQKGTSFLSEICSQEALRLTRLHFCRRR
jgi:peroxidase